MPIDLARLQLQERLRDLKRLRQLDPELNPRQDLREQRLAWRWLADRRGRRLGERLWEEVDGPAPTEFPVHLRTRKPSPNARPEPYWGQQWKRDAGLCGWLKQQVELPAERGRRVRQTAREAFIPLVQHPVRIQV